MSYLRTAARGVALAGFLALCLTSQSNAVSVSFSGVAPADAIDGYDAVELSAGNHVKGVGRYTYVFEGKQWRFASGRNKEQFKANPDKYID